MAAMHSTRLTMTCTRAAFGLAIGFGLLALPSLARAEDDVPFDTKIIRGLLEGIGLQRADRTDTINYQERPPLVLPPNDNLPPPVKVDAAVTNPAWPKDPDIARAKKIREQERKAASTEQIEHEATPLSPEELAPGAKNGSRAVNARRGRGPEVPGADGSKMTPTELGYNGSGLFGLLRHSFGKDDENEAAKFTGEPPRVSLTEPPTGYQTPSPGQPYGTGSRRAAETKVDNNYLSRGEMPED
jgi:hypothetical protein